MEDTRQCFKRTTPVPTIEQDIKTLKEYFTNGMFKKVIDYIGDVSAQCSLSTLERTRVFQRQTYPTGFELHLCSI